MRMGGGSLQNGWVEADELSHHSILKGTLHKRLWGNLKAFQLELGLNEFHA